MRGEEERTENRNEEDERKALQIKGEALDLSGFVFPLLEAPVPSWPWN